MTAKVFKITDGHRSTSGHLTWAPGLSASAFCSFTFVLSVFALPASAAEPQQSLNTTSTWTGVYLGADVAYRALKSDVQLPALALTNATVTLKDFSIGGHAGYRYQFSNALVIGAEFAVASPNAKTGDAPLPGFPGASWRVKSGQSASLRGTLGFAMDRTLIYASGGFASTKIEGCGVTAGVCVANTEFSGTQSGATIGLGIAHALGDNWSGRIEYDSSDFGSQNYSTPGSFGGSTQVDLQSRTLRAGVSYRF